MKKFYFIYRYEDITNNKEKIRIRKKERKERKKERKTEER